ncbi:MAG TPA: hypothetical protein VM221_12020 [Armatimonadota bacterium]|nr:hypothetical protein [Armatimonadota bacterium]
MVDGSGNTLASIAGDLANPTAFSFADGRAVCAVALWLKGQLTMCAGESLVMENPQDEWARRELYLLGQMDFDDCEISGAYWVVVGPSASGVWRNVRIVSGRNADSGYPLLYYNSSDVRWEGGLLDAHPAPDVFTSTAISCRGGYYPASVTNTIQNITIRSRDGAFDDPSSSGVNVDLTFENCVFQTSGGDHAHIVSGVNASDRGRTRVVLHNCRRIKDGRPVAFEGIAVHGSTGQILEMTDGIERLHVATNLIAIADDPPAGVWHHLSRLPALRHRVAELGKDARLRGSVYMPNYWLDCLGRIRTAIGSNGRYGPGDAGLVERLMDLAENALDHVPLTVQTGTPYRPRPARLEPPPPDRAHLAVMPDGRVRVDSYDSVLFYSPGGPGSFARLTEDSTIRERRVFDAYPKLGGPSLRTLAPSDSALMLWELPWEAQIVQNNSPIVGFKATLKNAPAHGAAVTHIFFHDLPDVILYDVASVQRGQPPESARVRFAAYATPRHKSYNGMRFWSDDPQGVAAQTSDHRETIVPGEPEHGLFVSREGNFWMYPHLTRGALIAQWNGYNDWRRYPPAGYVIRKDECAAIYLNATDYYAQVVELHKPQQTRYQLLWFEGGGLRCWENIFDLDDAFNHPCSIALRLEEGKSVRVEAEETAGLNRNVEIVVLSRVFNALSSDLAVFRGDSTIMLLRDVKAGSRRLLGTLPVTLSRLAPARFEIRNDLNQPLEQVEIRLPGAQGVARIRHGDQLVKVMERGRDALTYHAQIAPGCTEIMVE